MSLAAIWSGPTLDLQQANWKSDLEVAELVQRLAPRREPLDRAQALIHGFAQQAGEQKQPRLLALLAGLFTTLSAQRDSVLTGLDRFGRRQKELAAQIRTDNEKLRTLQGNPASDANAVAQATQQVTWEAALFQDRRQAISYACDVPGKIEQRLFALAHAIQQETE
ncbi:MAG: hypothetical protein P4L71_05190 [Acetobacteraceae bacterium]|nr:hypothetical protein [Acetobacteraceae bacterium]